MDKKFLGVIGVMLVICLLIAGAAKNVKQTTGNNRDGSGNSNPAYAERFFDPDKVIDIQIALSKADLEAMMANPTKEEYHTASVIVGGEKVDNVGFRIKGNSSLSSVARSDSERFSFKVDFDQYIEGQNLLGLTKLNLNNSFSDPSYMREYLSYSLLNQMKIPTPAFCYANIYLNGELQGLYLAVEGIEEPFLERYYGSDYGNLYKAVGGQGSDLKYTDEEIDSYSGLVLKTDTKNGTDAALVAMVEALNRGEDLEKYLNVDEILRYFAVNAVLVNMDSYLGNMKHNYYLYEKDGQFSILPWDYNMSFGGFGMGREQSSTSLHIDAPLSGATLAERPLLGKLLEVAEYKELYHKYIEEFIKGPFALANMQQEIDRVAAMIEPHLEKDPTKLYSMEQFEQAIAEGSTERNTEVQNDSKAVNSPVNSGGEATAKLGADGKETWPTVEQGQTPPQMEKGEIQPERGGDGMMQGAAIGLVKFTRERIDNVSQQLTGAVPVAENTSEPVQGNQEPGQPGKMGNRQGLPGDMEPPEGMQQGDQRMGNQGLPQTLSVQQLYLIGGSIILLGAGLWLVLKKRTKYSI